VYRINDFVIHLSEMLQDDAPRHSIDKFLQHVMPEFRATVLDDAKGRAAWSSRNRKKNKEDGASHQPGIG
jgi:hypothetical protein